jgi:hypothetical protein
MCCCSKLTIDVPCNLFGRWGRVVTYSCIIGVRKRGWEKARMKRRKRGGG